MTSGYPEITEQDPSAPMQPGDHRERLAKFVGELWAQRRHVIETRRRINKRFADENDWFVRKDTELVDWTTIRHGYAYRGALAGIPLRQLAASMGHDVRTHMKHYGQWTDEAGLDDAFGAAIAKLNASLTKCQQQMQQQQ